MSQSKPKILIVHNYYQIPGGEDTVVKNEKKLLEAAGHQVVLYARNNAELKNCSKWRKLLLPFTAIYSFRTVREVKKLIRENGIDLVHVHNTLTMVSPSVYYAAFQCKVPVIQTLHNFRMLCPQGSLFRENTVCEQCIHGGLKCAIRHSCYRDSKAQTIVSAAILWVHRRLGTYRKINYICLTEFNKEKILQLNAGGKKIIDPERIYIKPNFTYQAGLEDTQTAVQESNQIRGDVQESNQTKGDVQAGAHAGYFMYAGRLEALKGVDLLVEAFAQMPEEQLVVVGDGPMAEQLNSYVEEQQCRNITFTGRLQGSDYIEQLRHAKALVVTSQCYETFGMTIAEGFAYGVPAIVGDIGNIKSMVTDGVNGIRFAYNSKEALAEAVERFYSKDLTMLQKNARAYYEKHLKPEANYRILSEIYNSVLEHANGKGQQK